MAQHAASFTLGSNSERILARAVSPLALTTSWARALPWLAMFLMTKAAHFLKNRCVKGCYVLLRDRIEDVRQNIESDDFLGHLCTVFCQSSNRNASGLGDTRDNIKQEWSEKKQNT